MAYLPTLARNLFGEQNPLGRIIQMEGKGSIEVVGVASDIKHRNVKTAAPEIFYMPIRQYPAEGAIHRSSKIQVRTRMSSNEASAIAARHIRERRFPLVVRGESSLENDIGASYLDDRIRMQATSVFGLLALALTAAGIYGMISYSVLQRVRELSIRMAVGSTAFGIVVLVLKDSLKLLGLGLLCGIPAALGAMRILSRFAYQLSPIDPASLIGATLILTLTGIVAAVGPAWRAARLDPIQTLRL